MDPVSMMLVSAGVSAVSGAVAGAGTIAQGNANVAAAKAEQQNLNQMASEQMAVATRGADAKSREAKLIESRGLAVSAASGGGTGGNVLDLMGNIARDANVQERDILRTGQTRANDLAYKGQVGLATAKNAQGLGVLAAGGQVLSGVSDAFSKYGQASSMKLNSSTSLYNPWG